MPGFVLDNLLRIAVSLNPEARAKLLYDSVGSEAAHMSVAKMGDTGVLDSSDPVTHECHYICYLKGDNEHLYELNGGMRGHVDRGMLGAKNAAISAKALELGFGTFLEQAGEAQIGFSIVALARAQH